VANGVVLQVYTSVLNLQFHHRGKLHWTMHPVALSAEKILSFDTVTEAFRLRPRPPWPSGRYDYMIDICLLELNGMLAVTATETHSDSMELWVLEDYENDQSWSRCFRIDMPPHIHARWAIGTGVPDVILVGSCNHSFAALYHLTEKRIIKQIEFVNGKVGTPAGIFLFKDSLVPYDIFDPY
jgi:F-box interacting protein